MTWSRKFLGKSWTSHVLRFVLAYIMVDFYVKNVGKYMKIHGWYGPENHPGGQYHDPVDGKISSAKSLQDQAQRVAEAFHLRRSERSKSQKKQRSPPQRPSPSSAGDWKQSSFWDWKNWRYRNQWCFFHIIFTPTYLEEFLLNLTRRSFKGVVPPPLL